MHHVFARFKTICRNVWVLVLFDLSFQLFSFDRHLLFAYKDETCLWYSKLSAKRFNVLLYTRKQQIVANKQKEKRTKKQFLQHFATKLSLNKTCDKNNN